ncbi:uncharacterized protein LOC120683767 isoform X2 [Panicum virgatum]|uniref:Uncharacterized protein n=1 Tax=Panicum virgatum TaxID=38727 RepID=A0A8T0Q5T2_PANVG|nr:uncharacterized protein LOC120683767 isoform X2 [Panicum virgatum]KAG2569230.1 hypothetical protein PVAP13_7NG376000 [Panicum virgatum]
MRTSTVAFAALLLLLLLATRAHGIRLNRQLHEAITSKEMADPKAGAGEASVVADSEKKHCAPEAGRCSSGKVKKALARAGETAGAKQQQEIGSTVNVHDTTVVDAGATQQAGAASHGSPGVAARQRQTTTTYRDLMEIAGMDYSPATRKPPIHN